MKARFDRIKNMFLTPRRSWISAAFVLVALGGALFVLVQDPLEGMDHFTVDAVKYKGAEARPTNLASRMWMRHALEIAKVTNVPPVSAARYYAYVASVFADVLEATDDAAEASRATARFLDIFAPLFKDQHRAILDDLKVAERALLPEASKIVEEYVARSKQDGKISFIPGPGPTSSDGRKDPDSRAGEWETWILPRTLSISIPPAPKEGSLADRLDMAKVRYAVGHRTIFSLPTIYIWHGASGFSKGQAGDNVTPAGVWQNILFVEAGERLGEKEYARIQKLLAQSIADAFIRAWEIKYRELSHRPIERIPDIHLAVQTPPFPGYVSGHSAISFAAATILSHEIPELRNMWEANARDARNSRLVAGIHFDSDNESGEYLGRRVGEEILHIVHGTELSLGASSAPQSWRGILAIARLSTAEALESAGKMIGGWINFTAQPVFADKSRDAGITSKQGTGAAWSDYDNDGDQDLLFLTSIPSARLYRNNGDGTFAEVSKSAGLARLQTAISAVFGDYDNDGCEDLYVVRSGHSEKLTDLGDSDLLYRNNCDGTFRNVSDEAGIRDEGHGRGAAWSDYDQDGDLDIYVANHGVVLSSNQFTVESNYLWRNNGNGTFTEVASEAGVFGQSACDETRYTRMRDHDWKESYQPAWFDYDGDHLPDLFVATDSNVSPLYRNNGDGTFTEVTQEAGMCRFGTGMGVAVGDYDNDLDLDIYVTNVGFNYLWRNNGNGTFAEAAQTMGGADHALGWGVAFLDYDNDADLDLYVVNGNVSIPTVEVITTKEDKFYRNEGGGQFRQVAAEEGISGGEAKQTGAFADYDNDGFTDIFVGRSHYIDVDLAGAANRLYHSNKNGNHWIGFRLVGAKSNRSAIGAKVYLTAAGRTQMREISSGSSYLAGNSLWPIFGLAGEKIAEKVEIEWPSGIRQVLKNVAADQYLTVTEREEMPAQ